MAGAGGDTPGKRVPFQVCRVDNNRNIIDVLGSYEARAEAATAVAKLRRPDRHLENYGSTDEGEK